MDHTPVERRARQRILVHRPGQSSFVMRVEQTELELVDLSLEGFAVRQSTPPPAGEPFNFELRHEEGVAPVTGRAVAVNFLRSAEPGSGQVGCRFLAFEGEGGVRLRAWLAQHVAAVSALPVTEAEATAIVSGPSIA